MSNGLCECQKLFAILVILTRQFGSASSTSRTQIWVTFPVWRIYLHFLLVVLIKWCFFELCAIVFPLHHQIQWIFLSWQQKPLSGSSAVTIKSVRRIAQNYALSSAFKTHTDTLYPKHVPKIDPRNALFIWTVLNRKKTLFYQTKMLHLKCV